jgi:hypothetical protein
MDFDDTRPLNGMFERGEPAGRTTAPSFSSETFEREFGQNLRQALDVGTWRVGKDLTEEYDRIESEVREAVREEDSLQEQIRIRVFPKLAKVKTAPKNAGVYQAKREDLEAMHRGLLFRGGVEGCRGNLCVHRTLPLTIYQIGVSLVSYQGNEGTWCQKLYRRDLRQSIDNPVEETLRILEGRASPDRNLGALIQKTLLDYAERAILVRRSQAPWRMGQGNPVTYEVLTGGGNVDLMETCINILREMIEIHRKFIFVGSEPRDLHLLTIGHALLPYQYAIVATLADRLGDWLHQQRFTYDPDRRLSWDGDPIPAWEWIPRFIKTVAPQVIVGLFRASPLAPAQLFYSHVDHADIAAHIAIADSMLQEQRGSPLLLDLARHVGQAVFGDSLETLAESAYAAAGVPWRYRSDRTR